VYGRKKEKKKKNETGGFPQRRPKKEISKGKSNYSKKKEK